MKQKMLVCVMCIHYMTLKFSAKLTFAEIAIEIQQQQKSIFEKQFEFILKKIVRLQ